MDDHEYLPLDTLSTANPASAPAGALILPSVNNDQGYQLRFDFRDGQFAFRVSPQHTRSFRSISVEGRHRPALILKDWVIRVRPETVFSAYSGMAEPGDVFLLEDGTAGFVIQFEYDTMWVTKDGVQMAEPNSGNLTHSLFRGYAIGRIEDGHFLPLVLVDNGEQSQR